MHSLTLLYCRTETSLSVFLSFPESGCHRSLEWILEYQVTGLQSHPCATHAYYVPGSRLLYPVGLDPVMELSWLLGPGLFLCKSQSHYVQSGTPSLPKPASRQSLPPQLLPSLSFHCSGHKHSGSHTSYNLWMFSPLSKHCLAGAYGSTHF